MALFPQGRDEYLDDGRVVALEREYRRGQERRVNVNAHASELRAAFDLVAIRVVEYASHDARLAAEPSHVSPPLDSLAQARKYAAENLDLPSVVS